MPHLTPKHLKEPKFKKKTHTQDSQSIQTKQSNSNEQITNIAQFSPSTVILLKLTFIIFITHYINM